MSDVDFEVIVVGAGIAGSVAAYRLATLGHEVLLVERGAEPGAKNLSGGVLYSRVMEQVYPAFLEEAPLERRVTRNCLSFLTPTSHVNVDYRDDRLADPTNAVTVLRAKLDPWLVAQAEERGVTVMPGIRVDALLRDGARVVGIRAGEDELRARVVVAADGVNSFLCREAGIATAPPQQHLAVGVKSVIGLPRTTIEERFGLTGDEGAAYAVVGDATRGVGGGGFLYTNLDSLSVGVVLRLDDLTRSGLGSSQVHDAFLEHPMIARFLRDGELQEYGCHLIAEGGLHGMSDLVRPGLVVVGDAAGLTLNTGFTVRGMDLAAGSGIAAATAIDEALRRGDVSAAGLAGYPARLGKSFVGRDMRTYAKAPAFFENPRLYHDYGSLLSDVLYGVYDLDTTPRRHLLPTASTALTHSAVTKRMIIKDGLAAVRAL